jgi:U1 zinc finger
MDEKYYCNICNMLIDSNIIENHIKTQNHKDSKNQYIQQLNSLKTNEKMTNNSSYTEWKKYQKQVIT